VEVVEAVVPEPTDAAELADEPAEAADDSDETEVIVRRSAKKGSDESLISHTVGAE